MTAAYRRPHTSRATSNYTLTLGCYPGDAPTILAVLRDTLDTHQIIRTSSIQDSGRAGISWRSASPEEAQEVAQTLTAAVDHHGTSVLSVRLHTGYGIHTREVTTT